MTTADVQVETEVLTTLLNIENWWGIDLRVVVRLALAVSQQGVTVGELEGVLSSMVDLDMVGTKLDNHRTHPSPDVPAAP